jgi:hypothetical protein
MLAMMTNPSVESLVVKFVLDRSELSCCRWLSPIRRSIDR